MFEVVPIETPSLGDRSYLVHDGTTAFVVDPQRDIDRVLDLARHRGVAIRHVFETHIHNDYVTGGRALAAATGGIYHVNAADPVQVERSPIVDGDVVHVSTDLSVRAVATPGHTFTHLSYVLLRDGGPVAVFSGGSLLFGSTGRPDLLGPDATNELARAQHRSVRRLAAELPDGANVLPTHGFGSFCAATQSEASSATIGSEKLTNPALTSDEDTFVREILAGLDAYPAYYVHMGPANLRAPADPPELAPPRRADAAELRRRLDAGEWVVDLRERRAFASKHVSGTFNVGLDGSFATYLGWLLPWGSAVTLVGESPGQVAEAQRELVRIGIDRPAAAAVGAPAQLSIDGTTGELPVVTFRDLEPARQRPDVVVLDVRSHLEWADGHVTGAVHLPIHELRQRLDDVPAGQVWVHCGSGYRASIAASILAAAGRDVVIVDDDWDNAAPAGVTLAGAEAA